ncbi:MAG: hypothetical protein VYD19_09215 [Myxococcota bacterium]|nr:hypothetical protein [Myxococcota bacterium]
MKSARELSQSMHILRLGQRGRFRLELGLAAASLFLLTGCLSDLPPEKLLDFERPVSVDGGRFQPGSRPNTGSGYGSGAGGGSGSSSGIGSGSGSGSGSGQPREKDLQEEERDRWEVDMFEETSLDIGLREEKEPSADE